MRPLQDLQRAPRPAVLKPSAKAPTSDSVSSVCLTVKCSIAQLTPPFDSFRRAQYREAVAHDTRSQRFNQNTGWWSDDQIRLVATQRHKKYNFPLTP